MTAEQFNTELEKFKAIEIPEPEQIQSFLISVLDFLEEKCQNIKVDSVLEDIESRIKEDRYGVLKFLVDFIKLKRA